MGGTLVNAQFEAFQGSRSLNPFLPDNYDPMTPNIIGIEGGAEAFGLFPFDLAEVAHTLPHAPANASVLLTRFDGGPVGYDYGWHGFDMVVVADLSGKGLTNPELGVDGHRSPLMIGGYVNDPSFGGTGDYVLDQLGPYQVYATLIPDTATNVEFAASGAHGERRTVSVTLANGQFSYLTESLIVPIEIESHPNVAGHSLNFDGVDDFVQVANSASLTMADDLTMEAWIYPTGPGGDSANSVGTIVNKEGEYQVGRFTDGTIRWAIADESNTDTNTWPWINTGYFAPENQWTHVAIAKTGYLVNSYINGELVHSIDLANRGANSSAVGDAAPNLNDLLIGGRQDTPGIVFEGQLDEVRVWNVGRSQEEIRAAAIHQLADDDNGLVGYWRFDDGDGMIAVDASQFANSGRLGQGVASDQPVWTAGGRPAFDGDAGPIYIDTSTTNYDVSVEAAVNSIIVTPRPGFVGHSTIRVSAHDGPNFDGDHRGLTRERRFQVLFGQAAISGRVFEGPNENGQVDVPAEGRIVQLAPMRDAIKTLSGQPNLLFGSSIATLDNSLLIGAHGEQAAYLFDGLDDSNPSVFSGPRAQNLGQAVTLTSNQVFLGAPFFDIPDGPVSQTGENDGGAVWVFDRQGNDPPRELLNPNRIDNLDQTAGNNFGSRMTSVGNDVAIMAGGSGVVYIYDSESSQPRTTLTHPTGNLLDRGLAAFDGGLLVGTSDDQVLLMDIDTRAVRQTFSSPRPANGFGSSITAFGSDHVVIGASGGGLSGTASGVAYLFDARTAELLVTYHSPMSSARGRFGAAVAAVGDDKVLISATQEDVSANDAGTAYLFHAFTGRLLQVFQGSHANEPDSYFGNALAWVDDKVVIATPIKNTVDVFEIDDRAEHTITDVFGSFSFIGLDAGKYVVVPEFASHTALSDPGIILQLENGQSLSDINLGESHLVDAGPDRETREGSTLTLQGVIRDLVPNDSPAFYSWTIANDDGFQQSTGIRPIDEFSMDENGVAFIDVDFEVTLPDDGVYSANLSTYGGNGELGFSDVLDIFVSPASPQFEFDGSIDIDENRALALSVQFDDGGADEWSGSVDYGDGTVRQLAIDAATRTFELAHGYPDEGQYLIEVTLTDTHDNLHSTRVVPVTVNSAAPDGFDVRSELSVWNRLIDTDGTAYTVFTIGNAIPGDRQSVSVAPIGEGTYAAVWEVRSANDRAWNVYWQRFDEDGNELSPPIRVNPTAISVLAEPRIAVDATGNSMVVWKQRSSETIHLRVIDANGNPLDVQTIDPMNASSQGNPSVAPSTEGGFLVAWNRQFNDERLFQAYAQPFNSEGLPVAGEFLLNQNGSNNQIGPQVAFDRSGNLFAVWLDPRAGGTSGITGRWFRQGLQPGSFVAATEEFDVNTSLAGELVLGVQSIAFDPNGNAVVVWEDRGRSAVVARNIHGMDTVGSSEYVLSPGARPSIVKNSAAFSVVWEQSTAGVFLRQISLDDGQISAIGQKVSVIQSTENATHKPHIASIAPDLLLVSWVDFGISEGDTWNAVGSFLDGEDDWVITIDYGDMSTVQTIEITRQSDSANIHEFELSHRYVKDGHYDVIVTIKDSEETDPVQYIERVNVTNVAAIIPNGIIRSGSLNEGSSATFSLQPVDRGQDEFTYQWDIDHTGSFNALPGFNRDSITLTLPDDGTRTIAARVFDGDEWSNVVTLIVPIVNVPPSIDLGSGFSLKEGERRTLDAHDFYFDPVDPADNATFTWRMTDTNIGETRTIDSRFLPLETINDGTYIITLNAVDDDGDVGEGSMFVNVINVPPGVVMEGPIIGIEGSQVVISATATDPFDSLSFQWQVVSDNGESISQVGGADIRFTPQDNGIYTVSLFVDDGTEVSAATTELRVLNADPILISVSRNRRASINSPIIISGVFTDATSKDRHTGIVDLGGGTFLPVIIDGHHFDFSFLYPSAGDYAARLTIRDEDGGVLNYELNITVGEELPGDFNSDGAVNVLDINSLLVAINSGKGAPEFDFDANTTVDSEDVQILVEEIIGTLMGDANLDGVVDAGDLNQLGVNWQAEIDPDWSQGDFNGDGMVGVGDLNVLGVNWLRNVTVVEGPPGDFNGDEVIDVLDINALLAAVQSGDTASRFDLDDNGTVDSADVEFLVEEIIGTLMGDANLDGVVDAGDLNQLGVNWQAEIDPDWSQGDFNGDGMVGVGDLNVLGVNWLRNVTVVEGPPGDFNGDEVIDVLDINALLAAVQSGDTASRFDLDDNGTVDSADVEFLVEEIIGTLMGDANLDGVVDAGDLNQVGVNWQAEIDPDWSQGDFNGDGMVGVGDLNVLGVNWLRNVTVVEGPPGDFNGDEVIDVLDINALLAAVQSGDTASRFDLDDNGTVDSADVEFLVEEIIGTLMSDANLDGVVDAGDLNQLGVNWQAEIDPDWSQGDFNGDGMVGVGDLNVLGVNWLRNVTVVEGPPGDFNGDEVIDVLDINALLAAVQSGDTASRFDLDDNGTVDSADVEFLVEEIIGTLMSDANLDGVVDAEDLNQLGVNWQAEIDPDWSQGDFNGDGMVGVGDLNVLGVNWLRNVTVVEGPPGDFNGDEVIDVLDINALLAAVQSGDTASRFDLDDNGTVDSADVEFLVEEIIGTLMSDANLDGVVDAGDLNQLGVNWQAEIDPDWSQGDFNGDGMVGVGDLNVLGVNWLATAVVAAPIADFNTGDKALGAFLAPQQYESRAFTQRRFNHIVNRDLQDFRERVDLFHRESPRKRMSPRFARGQAPKLLPGQEDTRSKPWDLLVDDLLRDDPDWLN